MALRSWRATRRAFGVLLLSGAVVAAAAAAGTSSPQRSASAPPVPKPSASVVAPSAKPVFGMAAVGGGAGLSALLDQRPLHGWTEAMVGKAVRAHAALRGPAETSQAVAIKVVDVPAERKYLDSATPDGGDVRIQVAELTTVVGWEHVPLVDTRELTLRPDGQGRPEVVTDRPLANSDLFDLGPLHAVHSGRVIVIGDAPEATLQAVARVGAASIPKVTAFWGHDWAQRAVVVAPASLDEFAAQIGDSAKVAASFAAVTTGRAPASGPGSQPYAVFIGSRVYVNPSAWDALSLPGRDIVITHELTHVAAQAASRPGPPTWLAEGVADQVGFTGSGFPESLVVAAAFGPVRASGAPDALPGPSQFSGKDASVAAAAYAESDVAVRLIVRRYGIRTLALMFRDATVQARAGGGADQALAYALHWDLHTTVSAFTKQWQQELVRLAGR